MDRLTFIFIAAGALAGVLIGKRCFSIVDHGQFTSSDWSLGIASFAVIGGLFAFLATSFLRVGFGPAALSIIGYFSRAVHRERR